MYPLDDYTLLKDYKLNKLPVVLAGCEKQRMLREAGLLSRPWLSCQVCRSLWQLGHTLVSAGRWLEQRYAPLALNPNRGISAGAYAPRN
jgi:hypothetical protein